MIDTIFKILNFIIFLAVVAYNFRKSLIPYVKSLIIRKKKSLEEVYHNERLAEERYQKLYIQLGSQKMAYESLSEKMRLWTNKINLDHKLKKEECEKLEQRIKNRLLKQQEFLKERNILSLVAPRVVNALHNDLSEQIKDPQKKQAYYQETLTLLRASGD